VLIKVDEGFNEDLMMVAQCLAHIRHYVLRDEGKRFKKDDWLATLQWISAGAEALGRAMNALDPDYFQKRIDELNESIEKAYAGQPGRTEK